MASIQADERSNGIHYDFISQVRPDLEFYESLPRLGCWNLIPDVIIWDLDARFSDSHEHLMMSHVVPAADIKFFGDRFTHVPRKLATKSFSDPIKQLKDCVSLDPQNVSPHTCGAKKRVLAFSRMSISRFGSEIACTHQQVDG